MCIRDSLFLLFIFFGGKFFEQTPWFQTAKQWIYFITGWDLIFVLISTLIQFYFTIKYNKIVKSVSYTHLDVYKRQLNNYLF